MPPTPRRSTKLDKHPAEPASSADDGSSRGRAKGARTDAGPARPSNGRAGPDTREPEGDTREPEGDTREPEGDTREPEGDTREPEGGIQKPTTESRTAPAEQMGAQESGRGRRVQWTQDAKTVRAELTAWVAALRKAETRSAEAQRLIGGEGVPEEQARVIAERVAEQTGAPAAAVYRAAGLDMPNSD